MQKILKLVSLLNLLYEKSVTLLDAILYDLTKAKNFLKIVFKNTNRLQLTIIDKIRKVYIKNKNCLDDYQG